MSLAPSDIWPSVKRGFQELRTSDWAVLELKSKSESSSNKAPFAFFANFQVIPTHQSVNQEHCALLQLLVG